MRASLTKQLMVRLSPEDFADLKRIAKVRSIGDNLSAVMRILIREEAVWMTAQDKYEGRT